MRASSLFQSVATLLAVFFIFENDPSRAGEVLNLELGGGRVLELVRIEPGTFRQGSPPGEAGRGADETPRTVTLTRPFYLGKYPVMRGQFAHFVAESGYRTEAETGSSGGFGWDGAKLTQRKDFTWRQPGFPQTEDDPVTLVTYKDAGAFLQWLSRKSGRTFALPSEAQWEYAARAGGAPAMDAWHKENSGQATHPVGRKVANGFGLSDMLGNVWEWCEDWYAPYEAGDVRDPLQRNANLSDKPRRVLRGGSWLREPKFCRPAARYRNDALSRNADNGFRVMTFDLDPRAAAPAARPAPVNLEATEPRIAPVQSMMHRDLPVPLAVTEPPRSALERLLLIIFFFGIALMVIGIVISLIRRASTRARDIGPTSGGLSIQPLRVRVGEDGFWIVGTGVPAGALISCRYTANGNSQSKDVRYEAGPQGQFVFTGSRPSNVSVSLNPGGASGSTTSRRIGNAIGMDSSIGDAPPFLGHPPAY